MHPRFELLARPPRAVPLSLRAAMLGNFSFGFGSIFLTLGMIFFWIFAYPSLHECRFWFAGPLTPVRGTVLSAEETHFSEGGSKHRRGSPVFRYRYRFSDAQGEVREGVSYSTLTRYREGTPVEIEYDPDRSSVNRIIGARASPFGALTLFVLIFPGIGLPFVMMGVRDARRWNRLLVEGKVAAGRIVGRTPTNTSINKQPVIDFEIEFATFGGSRVRFHHKTHLTSALEDEVEEPVLYDPRRPEDAVLADGLPAQAVVGWHGQWESVPSVGLVVQGIALGFAHALHLAVGVWAVTMGP